MLEYFWKRNGKKNEFFGHIAKRPEEIKSIFDFLDREGRKVSFWVPRRYDILRFAEICEWTVKNIKRGEKIRILDVGAGTGFLDVLLARELRRRKINYEIIIADANRKILKKTKNIFKNEPGIFFKKIAVENILKKFGPKLSFFEKRKIKKLKSEQAIETIYLEKPDCRHKIDIVINSWMPKNVNWGHDIRKIGAWFVIYCLEKSGTTGINKNNTVRKMWEDPKNSYYAGTYYGYIDGWEGLATNGILLFKDRDKKYKGGFCNFSAVYSRKNINVRKEDFFVAGTQDRERYLWEESLEKIVGQERALKNNFF